MQSILVDTSVWVQHFREGSPKLADLLKDGCVLCHPFIIGELACGEINNRKEVLLLLSRLPEAVQAEHKEVLQFIEKKKLMSQGLGYVDVQLLAAAALSDALIWSTNKKLNAAAQKLKIKF